MKIDRRRFIEIKSDKKVDRQIITINENGVIEISREMQERAEEKCIFAAYQRRQQTAPFRSCRKWNGD